MVCTTVAPSPLRGVPSGRPPGIKCPSPRPALRSFCLFLPRTGLPETACLLVACFRLLPQEGRGCSPCHCPHTQCWATGVMLSD